MAEWLQLYFSEPAFWQTKQFLDVWRSFPSAERLAPPTGPVTPRDVIYRNAQFLDDGIANFVKLAEDGNNQALLGLARLAAFICESLNDILQQDQERIVFISKRMPVWPINLVDQPNVLKQLDALLKILSIGQGTDDPYDVPRSRTKGRAAPKETAIRLVSIIDALDKFGWAKEEFEMIKAEFSASPNKYSSEKKAKIVEFHTQLVEQYFTSAAKHLDDFAAFLEVDNPLQDREAAYQESRTCHCLNGVVGEDAWAKKGIELLEKFTDKRPEQCRVFGETGKSKARATLRESGKKVGPLPKRSIATGIRGQVKQAFKVLRRTDGTLGTPPVVSWSSRETIEKFLATGMVMDEQIAQELKLRTAR